MPPTPVPQHCPTPRELDDLELLATGALRPTVGFNEEGSPVTLTLPPAVAEQAEAAGAVELVDPEGLPLARVDVATGAVEPLTHAQYGPFRRYYLSPAETRARYAGRTFVLLRDALTATQLEELAEVGPLVLLPLVGAGMPVALSPVALIRATLAAAALLPDAAVVAIPLASHDHPGEDQDLAERVLDNYAADDEVYRPVDAGTAYPPAIQHIVEKDRPAPDQRGLVLFFTGLSGSGKSTLARALVDRILERGERTITSLDGDVVRRNLSAGLTFSKEDRETNIRRIGWVAAEISRHGGIAVCSPIAPFDETRQQVRSMVEDAGGVFFLVHVATPLEECERRDRKGLYAKARRGEIPEFTGISSPYEEPADADVKVDTTGRTIEDALDDVIIGLRDAGYLDLESGGFETQSPVVEQRAPASVVETAASAPPDHLRVLFVCTANICRSPFMELTARSIAGPDATVDFSSAGTHGSDGGLLYDEMAPHIADADDVSAFRSRAFTAQLLQDADLVLTAEASHRTFILDDHPGAFRKVFTLGQFAEAVQSADPDLSGRDLIAEVGRHRVTARADLDVADPYRRGPDAARVAAGRITDLLRVVVPALTGSRKIES